MKISGMPLPWRMSRNAGIDACAHRTHHESRRQGAEGGDEVDRADAVAGVKHLRNRGGDVAVDPEVVPLHEVADRNASDGPAHHFGVGDLDLVTGPATAPPTQAG
jgi:hypothetical protein